MDKAEIERIINLYFEGSYEGNRDKTSLSLKSNSGFLAPAIRMCSAL